MATTDVDIFVGNNTLVDPDIYQLWLNGYTAEEAAVMQQKREHVQRFGVSMDMVRSDVRDNYRTFIMLEKFLKNPPKLSEQLQFQLSPETRTLLIERYYDFDDCVIRDFLGKKLSSRDRNSLDDVSDKTRVPLRSCRRQFDNVKRVFKTVEEMMGSLVDNIKLHFHLSHKLAQQYAGIVFMTNNHFETGKKKLAYLTLTDFIICANEMITNWSYSSKDCAMHEDMDVDMDRAFLHGLRDVKVLSEKENIDTHKFLVCRHLQGKISPSSSADLDVNFRPLSKTLINIAYGLNHSKELRDLFVDLVEKFIEPCKHSTWSLNDIREFLRVYQDTSKQLNFFKRQSPHVAKVWDRYMKTVSTCIIQMYHS